MLNEINSKDKAAQGKMPDDATLISSRGAGDLYVSKSEDTLLIEITDYHAGLVRLSRGQLIEIISIMDRDKAMGEQGLVGSEEVATEAAPSEQQEPKDPEKKHLILYEAQQYMFKGEIDQAISVLLKFNPPNGTVFNMLGDLYFKQGDKKKAAECFHQSVACYKVEGDPSKLRAIYLKVLNIQPDDLDALLGLGAISEALCNIADVTKFYYSAANIFINNGNKKMLKEIYQKLLLYYPSNENLIKRIADIDGNVDEIS